MGRKTARSADKSEILAALKEDGASIREVSIRYGVPIGTVYGWRNEANKGAVQTMGDAATSTLPSPSPSPKFVEAVSVSPPRHPSPMCDAVEMNTHLQWSHGALEIKGRIDLRVMGKLLATMVSSSC